MLESVRQIMIVAAFVTIAPHAALCEQARQGAGDTAKTVQALMKQESKWVRAVLRRDAKSMNHLLADDYIGSTSFIKLLVMTRRPYSAGMP